MMRRAGQLLVAMTLYPFRDIPRALQGYTAAYRAFTIINAAAILFWAAAAVLSVADASYAPALMYSSVVLSVALLTAFTVTKSNCYKAYARDRVFYACAACVSLVQLSLAGEVALAALIQLN